MDAAFRLQLVALHESPHGFLRSVSEFVYSIFIVSGHFCVFFGDVCRIFVLVLEHIQEHLSEKIFWRDGTFHGIVVFTIEQAWFLRAHNSTFDCVFLYIDSTHGVSSCEHFATSTEKRGPIYCSRWNMGSIFFNLLQYHTVREKVLVRIPLRVRIGDKCISIIYWPSGDGFLSQSALELDQTAATLSTHKNRGREEEETREKIKLIYIQ